MHGDQIPHPLEDSDDQIPSSLLPGTAKVSSARGMPGGGGGYV